MCEREKNAMMECTSYVYEVDLFHNVHNDTHCESIVCRNNNEFFKQNNSTKMKYDDR